MKTETIGARRRGRGDKVPTQNGADGTQQQAKWVQQFRAFQERQKNGRMRSWTPWLFIRYAQADLGFRPIPPGTTFWESPDIWIESSDPDPGKAVAGQNNFVHARVFNLGKADALPTRVDFYWANPALGLGPANMNWIGTEWVEVAAHFSLDVRCNTPWVPLFLNGGHECLIVNCSSPILDPIQQPYQPVVDRHVGQRNIAVIEAMAGEVVHFSVALSNLLPLMAKTTITARIEHVAVAAAIRDTQDQLSVLNLVVSHGQGAANTTDELLARFREGTAEQRRVRAWADFLASTDDARADLVRGVTDVDQRYRSAPYISSTLAERGRLVKQTSARGYLGLLLTASDTLMARAQSIESDELVVQEISLQSSEQRNLILEMGVPANARQGEFVVFHMTQKMEGLSVGGYTVVLRVVPGTPDR